MDKFTAVEFTCCKKEGVFVTSKKIKKIKKEKKIFGKNSAPKLFKGKKNEGIFVVLIESLLQ